MLALATCGELLAVAIKNMGDQNAPIDAVSGDGDEDSLAAGIDLLAH